MLCGYARIGGFAVGIVANQKTHVQQVDHAGNKRMEFGGVIYTESAEKAARFIMDCNQNLVPLVFLHDVNGFMVGRDAEWSGIIRAGAKMVNAVSNSVVPKIAVIIGGSFGAGHYAMCGKAYDPRFVFAWPTAKYAVMSGASAAGTLVEIKIKQLERGGKKLSEEDRKKLYDEVKATYDEQMDPRYGAARLWIDKIIDPAETREAIITRAGGGGAESRGAEVQRGSVADVEARRQSPVVTSSVVMPSGAQRAVSAVRSRMLRCRIRRVGTCVANAVIPSGAAAEWDTCGYCTDSGGNIVLAVGVRLRGKRL